MSQAAVSFQPAGGTLREDSAIYVERRADDLLYRALKEGRYCYILDSRQVGKSSLMARASKRLRDERIATVFVDLGKRGTNATAEQWYFAQIDRIGQEVDLRREVTSAWTEYRRKYSPLECWSHTLEEVILPRLQRQLVVFIDEIDSVLKVTQFSTDEFFAAIRALYNERTRNPKLEDLTFCLAGVASPSDLIKDSRTTPYNIGQRIELADFTLQEASVFQSVLSAQSDLNAASFERVYHWTRGHPYLTHRLCERIAEVQASGEQRVQSAEDVDRICHELFLKPGAAAKDNNLLFTSKRMLDENGDPAAVLDLYRKAFKSKRVVYDDTSKTHQTLRLSGVARVKDGHLEVRNPIYSTVFGLKWIAENRPEAAKRRERAAALRAALVTAAIAVAIMALAYGWYRQSQQTAAANQRTAEEKQAGMALKARAERAGLEKALAEANAQAEAQKARLADMTAAHSVAKVFATDAELLASRTRKRLNYSLQLGLESLRRDPRAGMRAIGPILQAVALLPRELPGIKAASGRLLHLNGSPNGTYVAAGFDDGRVQIWTTASRKEVPTKRRHQGAVFRVAFSPDERYAVSAGTDGLVLVHDLQNGESREVRLAGAVHRVAFIGADTFIIGGADGKCSVWEVGGRQKDSWNAFAIVTDLAVTADARFVASGTVEGVVLLRRLSDGRDLWRKKLGDTVTVLAFSRDGRFVAAGDGSGGVVVFATETGREITRVEQPRAITGLDFSADSKYVVSASTDGQAIIWETATGRLVARMAHEQAITALVVPPSGSHIITASTDETVRAWTLPGGLESGLMVHESEVRSLAFGAGETLISGGGQDIRFWRLNDRPGWVRLPSDDKIEAVAFTRDGRYLLAAAERVDTPTRSTVRGWKVGPEGRLSEEGPMVTTTGARSVVYSPNGERLVSIGGSTATVWEVPSGARIAGLSHDDLVHHAAFSPDGSLIATAGKDRQAIVWDSRGRKRNSFDHSNEVNLVAFSPDGLRLAAASEDNFVHIWNLGGARSSEAAVKLKHDNSVTRLAYSPRGDLIAAADDQHNVKIWKSSGQLVREFSREAAEIADLRFSPAGKYLGVVTGQRADIILVDNAFRRVEFTQFKPVKAIAFSPDEKYLAVGGGHLLVEIFDIAAHRRVHHLMHTRSPTVSSFRIADLAFGPAASTLVTGTGDGKVRIWATAPGAPARLLTIQNVYGPVTSIAVNSVTSRVAVGIEQRESRLDHHVTVWDMLEGREVARYTGHDRKVFSVNVNHTGRLAVSASLDTSARVWDLRTGVEFPIPLEIEHDRAVNWAEFSPDGKRVVAASDDGKATLWPMVDGEQRIDLDHQSAVLEARFSGPGRVFARTRTAVHLWDVAKKSKIRLFELTDKSAISAMAVSPDGRHLALGGRHRTAVLFDVATGRRRAELRHGGSVNAVAFSADSRYVATGSDDETVRLRELASGSEKRIWTAGKVTSVSFHPKEGYLLAHIPEMLQIFDLRTAEEVALIGRGFNISRALFAPTGADVLASSSEGSGWLIPISPERIRALACGSAIPPINSSVWNTYARGEPLPQPCLSR